MSIEEILSKLDYILKNVNEMETFPLESLDFEVKIKLISNAIGILRNDVEKALREKRNSGKQRTGTYIQKNRA